MNRLPLPSYSLRDSFDYWAVAGATFCAFMIVVHVRAGLLTAGLPDFWRDMYWATVIAHGERFPLSGPPINHVFELGPWWYYLLALPVWLTSRIAVASAFVQLLASMKYVLAWRLGTRWVDARFGAIFASCLAIAGWSTAPLWFPSHPAVVETTLLLLAFATARCWRNLSFFDAVLFGLAAAACLHAHPSTITYVAAAGVALLYRNRSWRVAFLLAIAALIVFVSLLPPWLDAAAPVAGGQVTLEQYVASDVGVDFFSRLPALLAGLVVNGAWTGFLLMTTWSEGIARFAWWLYCVCLLFAFSGFFLLRREQAMLRLAFVGALASIIFQVAFLALVRKFTPIWMLPSCLPPLALVLAIGWYGWACGPTRPQRITGGCLLVVFVALSLAPFAQFQRVPKTMRVMPTANPLFNMSDVGGTYSSVAVPVVSVREMDVFARVLCSPTTLHARVAAAVENSLAVPERNACGHWPDLMFSGQLGAGPHLAGIPARAVAAIGVRADRVVGGMAFYSRVIAIAPVHGARVEGLRRMQVSAAMASGPPSAHAYSFDASAGDVVVLTSRFTMSPLTVLEVHANDVPASLLFSDGKMFIYGCAGCAGASRAHWNVRLVAIERNLDLVVIADALPTEKAQR